MNKVVGPPARIPARLDCSLTAAEHAATQNTLVRRLSNISLQVMPKMPPLVWEYIRAIGIHLSKDTSQITFFSKWLPTIGYTGAHILASVIAIMTKSVCQCIFLSLGNPTQGRVNPMGTLGTCPGALELQRLDGARSQSLRVNRRLWLMTQLSPWSKDP